MYLCSQFILFYLQREQDNTRALFAYYVEEAHFFSCIFRALCARVKLDPLTLCVAWARCCCCTREDSVYTSCVPETATVAPLKYRTAGTRSGRKQNKQLL